MPAPMSPPPPPMPMGAAPNTTLQPGSLFAAAQEQDGSKFLQARLKVMPPAELAAAVAELAPHLATLASHPFGNYLVSAMTGIPAAHQAIHAALTGRLCSFMQHPQGSRVCQHAFEKLP